MTKVVLDTNVLISAIIYGGKPRTIVEAALAGTIEIYVSEAIIGELEGVLGGPQFGLSAQFVRNTMAELAALAEWVAPGKHINVVQDDPADNFVLDCALAAEADYLVTGDGHLLRLGVCGGVRIISPQEFLEILQRPQGVGPED